MKGLLLKSTAFRFLERFIILLISLLMTPFFIHHLGEEGYGLWIIILSVLTWFNVVNLGFPSAVQRHITLALEAGDEEQVNRVFSTSIVLFLGLGIIAATGLLTLAQFPSWLGISGPMEVTLSYCFLFLSLKILWGFLMNCLHGFYVAVLRFDIDANISSLNAIMKAIIVYLTIPQLDIYGAVLATLIADVITNGYKVYWVKKNYPYLTFRRRFVSKAEFSSLFHFSKYVVASGIASTINTKSDPVIVSKFMELATVTLFSIATRLCGHVQAFVLSVSGLFQPIFTRMVARGTNMERLYNQVTSLNLFVCTALFLPLFIFSPLFVELWVGPKFIPATDLIGFFIFGYMCIAVGSGVNNVLFAQANHNWIFVGNLLGAFVHIAMSVYLLEDYGLIGVAIGTPAGFIISELIFKFSLLKYYCNFRLLPIYLRFGYALVVLYGLGIPLKQWLQTYTAEQWLICFGLAFIILPITTLIAYVAILDPEVKRKIIELALQIKSTRWKGSTELDNP
ncbi:oligosaccharide flippase family protein [Thalassotalea mangrovi]|uniref:Polysaccharide biosynthesis protein C-terminal domain-containing protein n=1 Tax=Thalassotalea mangrovi TaxID=2572245 RepID=A0A4U1B7Z4_9GAMM|nr:oligosaccharide flippase family protein [Thalassotalea mangrovi]TKB46629.1 hypothetical protein E8M12_03495 [Thalassotalea mangrovi]